MAELPELPGPEDNLNLQWLLYPTVDHLLYIDCHYPYARCIAVVVEDKAGKDKKLSISYKRARIVGGNCLGLRYFSTSRSFGLI